MIGRVLTQLTLWARALKNQIAYAYALARHPNLPLWLKVWWWFTLAYALSPIDLIPDFIPILGMLDELILLPLMLALGLKFTPKALKEALNKTAPHPFPKPSMLGATIILGIWLLAAYFVVRLLLQ